MATRKQKKREAVEVRRAAPWTFPRHPLEDALRIPRAIEEKHGGAPIRATELAAMVGFKNPDWRFLDLLRSANQYGLVEGSGATATVSLTERGNMIVAPKTPMDRQNAMRDAVMAVSQFKEVLDFYKGKFPELEFFRNKLVKDFQIPKDRVDVFVSVLNENLNYLKSFGFDRDLTSAKPDDAVVGDASRESTPREFLDTCFMMMPFGGHYDTYYREVYAPAIKDAGFEPVRADEIFQTGTVMEQIWTQLEKCFVVLAELTGRNPNVFYEMGLAHAAKKPVVFVSASLEDVPFDLKHLRIVLYDTSNPFWGDKLRKDIATYLREVRKDPALSIPNPFRS